MKYLLVIAGPSGVGKTYLAQQLLKLFPSKFASVKLYTTRSPREDEAKVDRIFVSAAKFRELDAKGKFFIAEKFHNNWYGFKKSDLLPGKKYLIVNAWPALLPRFKNLQNVYFVGLIVSKNHLDILQRRMIRRGDSPAKVSERIPLIKKDISDLLLHEDLVNRSGKMFMIENDQTIHDAVIPWIKQMSER